MICPFEVAVILIMNYLQYLAANDASDPITRHEHTKNLLFHTNGFIWKVIKYMI